MCDKNKHDDMKQRHVHEFLGSTGFDPEGERRHNHRFAAVTGEEIPIGKGKHVHKYYSKTDFVNEHYHQIAGTTGPDIMMPNGNHIHFEESVTSFDLGHRHEFVFTTLLEAGNYK